MAGLKTRTTLGWNYINRWEKLLGLRILADVVRTSRDLQVIRCAGLAGLKPRSLFEVQNHQNRHSGQAQRDSESSLFETLWIPAFAGVTEK